MRSHGLVVLKRGAVGAVEQPDARTQRRGLAARHGQHGLREINARDRGLRKEAAKVDQIFPRATAGFEDARRTGGRRRFAQYGGATEKKTPARGVVNMRMQPVISLDRGCLPAPDFCAVSGFIGLRRS